MSKKALAKTLYSYKAIDKKNGAKLTGVILARNEVDLGAVLDKRSLELVNCSAADGIIGLSKSSKISLRDLDQFYVLMQSVIAAKITLLNGLDMIIQCINNKALRDIVISLYHDISEGESLSEAMAGHPKIFDKYVIALISVAEATGDYEEPFARLALHTQWVMAFRKKIKKALTYPAIIVVALVAMAVVMLGFAVPQMIGFLTASGIDLPGYTIALINTSQFMQTYWWLIPSVIIGFIAIYKFMQHGGERTRYMLDSAILKAYIIGNLVRKINIVRFVQTLSVLYENGYPLVKALSVSRSTINNAVICEAIDQATADIKNGTKVSRAFERTGQFTVLTTDMLAIGEETGQLGTLLNRVSDVYNSDIDDAVNRMVALIEPSLIAATAGLIMWIAAATFGPIYGSLGELSM